MTKRKTQAPAAGQFAYTGLERAIHEKARLGIMTTLFSHPAGVAFNDLKSLCDLTDGNLNRHLDVLLQEGLVTVEKQDQQSGRAKSVNRLTARGRQRFLAYLEELQRVITDAAAAQPDLASRLVNWSLP